MVRVCGGSSSDPLANVQAAFDQLGAAMSLCIDREMRLAALMLLYSAIDVAGWMAAQAAGPPVPTGQAAFTAWTEKYLRPKATLGCSALELYAARCGVVHTMTPESELFRQGRVLRQVIYAWLPSTVEKLSAMTDFVGRGYVAVQGDWLVRAFQVAVRTRFLPDLRQSSPEQLQPVTSKVFTTMPPAQADDLLMRAYFATLGITPPKKWPGRSLRLPPKNKDR